MCSAKLTPPPHPVNILGVHRENINPSSLYGKTNKENKTKLTHFKNVYAHHRIEWLKQRERSGE
jgi:hypothetical protein